MQGRFSRVLLLFHVCRCIFVQNKKKPFRLIIPAVFLCLDYFLPELYSYTSQNWYKLFLWAVLILKSLLYFLLPQEWWTVFWLAIIQSNWYTWESGLCFKTDMVQLHKHPSKLHKKGGTIAFYLHSNSFRPSYVLINLTRMCLQKQSNK